MNVLLATAYPTQWTYLPRFEELAASDRVGEHVLTDDAAAADIILFVDARHEHGDWKLSALRRHPLYVRYRDKSFLYNEMDQPWCALPGIYVSMPKPTFNPQRQRAGCYVVQINPYVESMGRQNDAPDLLFSFTGRRCYPVRDVLLGFSHPRALIEDTSQFNFFGDSDIDVEPQKKQYAQVISRSKFVLCPRGSGPASFRLFETMAAGRVPVIISDEWVPPQGPDWKDFALIVPEAQAKDIPQRIEALEDRFAEMGQLAREAWEQWFAPDMLFHRMIEGCRDIMQNRHLSERVWHYVPDRRAIHLWARHTKGNVMKARKG